MKQFLFAIALFSLTGITIALTARGQAPMPNISPTENEQVTLKDNAKHPTIEVVFALDTTGSMGGMIEAAKEKIWSIATTLASAEPAPEIRVGLVAYRDQGDAYVTKTIDLSSDLDAIFAQLMQFQAQGGGDTPEAVNQALHDAVNGISWSNDQQAYQVVFLVGDAPAHENEAGIASFETSLAKATKKGVVINAIQCGESPSTRYQWQRIASLGQGEYLKVDQNGSAIASATPFDNALAELSRELESTRVFYGTQETRDKLATKSKTSATLYERASKAILAKRAEYNSTGSGAKNLLGERELVTDIKDGVIQLANVADELLPAPMVAMSPEEKDSYVQAQIAKRDDIRAQIKSLSVQRQAYIDAELVDATSAEDSLDFQLFNTLKKQAAERGIAYDESDLRL